jgi:hypothetical protein
MICDLLNNQAPSQSDIDCKLLYPVICAFKTKDKTWLNLLPHCHKWLFSICLGISKSRGWDIFDIYRGMKPVQLNASQDEHGMTFRLLVEGFQYSKMTFTMGE